MSQAAHPPHDGSLVPPGHDGLKRTRRHRRTRRQRRAALAIAAVCALVLGEALAHVFDWWPTEGGSPTSERSPFKRPRVSPRAPETNRVLATNIEAPRPIDTPIAVELSDALPALDAPVTRSVFAAGTWSPPSGQGSLVAPLDGSAPQISPVAAGPSEPRVASAAIPGAGPFSTNHAAAAPSAPVPAAQAPAGVITSPQTPIVSPGSPIVSPGSVGEEALRRAASAALARERNINKVRTYPNRPGWHVNND
jgi:hypothetical protein